MTWLTRKHLFLFLAMTSLLLTAPVAVSAHSIFIQSGRQHVSVGKSTPLFFCYGHHFPVDDGVRRKKLKSVRVHMPTGNTLDVALRDETCLHSYMVEYSAPGTYALTAETNPGYYTKWIDKKGRERNTIRSMAEIGAKASKILKSLYSKQYAKTYVAAGTPSETFPARVGLPLELAPSKDVFGLRKNDVLELQVYRDGIPYTGEGFWDATYTGFSTEAEDMFFPKTKTSDGKIHLLLKETGRWFVRFFVKTDAAPKDADKYLQMKQTATLVFEVPNERKRPKVGH